ncbi:hypothetical protein DUY81_08520 [Acidipropionibacterium acidipropionici]|uniref:Uncharacterized protein n=1 Tax=Acidipropionibacterium acidipropionici TaxID=1748 RepID=A0AAC9AMW5_9ACTN|nr:hypothetical protein [Acidipropionibacterium acidipropionici]AMS04645.1 hypothetical protein AXH35_03265 [Acidipropionibacterium acidipropionici]AOZ46134.1 hypothetical protein A8L58_04730 [Acidipropionibacterium acidipropionici]AZP37837.1 hypothetical protein DUY81_08520 [Acidipropionibacterium acidipropionici]
MNDFTELIDTLAEGETANEGSRLLNQIIKECRDTGNTGSITLRITIVPKYGDGPDLEISDDLSHKSPKRNRLHTFTWVDKKGHWSRTNPDQDALPNITDISVRGDH